MEDWVPWLKCRNGSDPKTVADTNAARTEMQSKFYK
jgi:hypothetical protein